MARRRRRSKTPLIFALLAVCVVALILYLVKGGGAKTGGGSTSVVELNEVMSSNKGAVADETGDFPDWVEFHNKTGDTIDISGYGLSDDLLSAAKWTFPSGTTIPADGYIVVFCSGDVERGKMHAGFRLSASDSVILSTATGAVVDSIQLKAVDSGMSLGRDANNGASWTTMQPSPGYPNTPEGVAAYLATMGAGADESIGVYINEFMPSNASTLVGPDGAYCDWIELYNTTDHAVDLSGYGISDTPAQPLKYTLPKGTSIEPNGVLLIYCTGRETPDGADRIEAPFGLAAYQESVVFSTPGGKILDQYDYTRAETDISWARTPDGTGDFAKSSQPTPGYANNSAGLQAFMAESPFGAGNIVLSEALNANYSYLKQPGDEYYDWVEVHNTTGSPIPLKGYALSNNAKNPAKWVFPDITLEAGEYLAILASGRNVSDAQKKNNLETNFRLSGDGAVVLLFTPEGEILDKLQVPKGRKDISYGRTDGQLLFYSTPTPNEANSAGVAAYCEPPVINLASGCYDGAQQVSITAAEGATVTYTTDGTEPTASSNKYAGSFSVNNTTVLRARAFAGGMNDSDVSSASFIIYTGESTVQNHRHTLPVVSIITDPKNLWDPDIGIYVVGNKFAEAAGEDNADNYTITDGMNNPNGTKANFWQQWERPVHFDLIDETGTYEFGDDCIIRIFGAFSRAKEQKGLSLVARPGYGGSTFKHAFFKNRPYTEYKSVVLRSSAQDATYSRIRDIVITSLLGDHDLGLKPESQIAVQAYRQVVVYLNGKYWGVYNLREKISKSFIAQHYGINNPDTIDILIGNGNEKCVVAGNGFRDYTDMVTWADQHDLSVDSNYQYICSLMDVENFAAYTAAEIIVGNTDSGNIKYWRTPELDNKWRWLFYDFCWAMNRDDDKEDQWSSGFRRDFFTRYFYEGGHGAGGAQNKGTSTKLVRALLKNAEFRSLFLSKVAIMVNEVYTPEKIIARVDECQQRISDEMVFDVDLWDNITYDSWKNHCDNIRAYAKSYQAYCLKYCKAYFSLSNDDMMRIFGRTE